MLVVLPEVDVLVFVLVFAGILAVPECSAFSVVAGISPPLISSEIVFPLGATVVLLFLMFSIWTTNGTAWIYGSTLFNDFAPLKCIRVGAVQPFRAPCVKQECLR